MKISTKGRYALRMMLDLAEHSESGFIALKDIAKRQNISKKYLEQIVPVLNKSKFLIANRGSQGGYKLSKSLDRYTVGDILRATEGNLSPAPNLNKSPEECDGNEYATIEVWKALDKTINCYLDSITLEDLLEIQTNSYSNSYII
ncbi:MAG: RrF2 family transcriptional regulator [Acutalibacteraceae bacterium]